MNEKTIKDMEKQFNLIAEEYDANRRRFIPCFDGFYQETTDFIAANLAAPGRVLDLGAGTGLLTYFWYRRFPAAEYVLVDVADEMLQVARRRFAGLANVDFRVLDYTKELPEGRFDVVTSALSIHHLEHDAKRETFARLYELLPAGGLLVNYDQFCGDTPRLGRWYDEYWEGRLAASGLSTHDLELWRRRRLLDRECSVEQERLTLRQAGFSEVGCVYACQKFAVIAAVK